MDYDHDTPKSRRLNVPVKYHRTRRLLEMSLKNDIAVDDDTKINNSKPGKQSYLEKHNDSKQTSLRNEMPSSSFLNEYVLSSSLQSEVDTSLVLTNNNTNNKEFTRYQNNLLNNENENLRKMIDKPNYDETNEFDEPFSPDVSIYEPSTEFSDSENDSDCNKRGIKKKTIKSTKTFTPSRKYLFPSVVSTPESFKEALASVQKEGIISDNNNPVMISSVSTIYPNEVHFRSKYHKTCQEILPLPEKVHHLEPEVIQDNVPVTEHNALVETEGNPVSDTEYDSIPDSQHIPLPAMGSRTISEPEVQELSIKTNPVHFVASITTVYINDENFVEAAKYNRESRKRVRDEKNWQFNKNKIQKNSGKEYESIKTKTNRPAKNMGDSCLCRKKCYEKINDSQRLAIFKYFWNLADHERQWDYILRFVQQKPIRTALLEAKRFRTQSLEYSLMNGQDTVIVCKKMFLSTLSINEKTVYTAIGKQESHNIKDLRGIHHNRPRKVAETTVQSVINHITLFPKKESHYLRQQSKRQYLCENLNRKKMHRLYLNWMKNNPDYENVVPASERFYCHIFNTRFNLGFFHPKKDMCEICSLYTQADSERKVQLKEEYDTHMKNKERVRAIKNEEKENCNEAIKTVACFDLEKVLSIPQSEVGVFHYKRKYPVYNLTIYNILKKEGHCFVWHAQLAKRGANEIASCLWIFIKNEAAKGIKSISFYSDNCTGQNRNRFVFALYLFACQQLNIDIVHRFLQKGHTQNEGDSMHSCIERAKKNKVLFVPDQVYAVIRNAKVQGNKYSVNEMTQTDFFDWKRLIIAKNWEKDITGKKVSWNKIKEIAVHPESPTKNFFKYDFDDEPNVLDTLKQTRNKRDKNVDNNMSLVLAYNGPLPISNNLYKDLISLCDSLNIPAHYHNFYRGLVSTNNGNHSESDD